MGALFSTIAKGPGALLGIPNPIRDAVFGGDKEKEKKAAPRQSIASRAAARSLSNEDDRLLQ